MIDLDLLLHNLSEPVFQLAAGIIFGVSGLLLGLLAMFTGGDR